jgi:hypothetical protein
MIGDEKSLGVIMSIYASNTEVEKELALQFSFNPSVSMEMSF